MSNSNPATAEQLLQHFVCLDIAEHPDPYELPGAWRYWVVSERPPISAWDAIDGVTKAKEHESQARQALQSREDSFDRCDTDGFLSQWSDGLTAQKERRKAELARNGGYALFPALYRQDGTRVPAKIIDTQYGCRWALLRDDDRFTGEFFPTTTTRRGKLAKHGYVVVGEWRRAKVVLTGRGRGLSGSCWVATVELSKEELDELEARAA